MSETPTIVEARAGHAPFIAWVVLTAFRSHLEHGLWDFFIDDDEPACLRYLETLATTDTPHWAHYSGFLVAEVDGRPAAALCGYFDEERGMPALQKAALEADERLGRTREESRAGFQRIAPILHVMPDHEPGAWIVENVATDPAHRRLGIVDALLTGILERGRERGATRADIGVMIGNDPAQRAYEKAGFRVTGDKRHPDFEAIWGCPGLRQLSRDLQPAAAL
jgi:ribosomal protein S18 acetylase RimI-like enzyme